MSDAPPAATPRGRPPALEARGLRGWVTRLWRRLTLAALRPELDAFVEHDVRQTGERTSFEGGIRGLQSGLSREERSRHELQAHLDARLDQSVAETADLRGALLAVRGEFEQVRDQRLPDAARAQAALQREVEEIRDTRLPQAESGLDRLQSGVQAVLGEVEGLRDRRLPQAELALAGIQTAIEHLQSEVAEVRDSRLARAEVDLARFQRSVTEFQEEIEALRDGRVPSVETGLGRLHDGLTLLQGEIRSLRDQRVPAAEAGLDGLQTSLMALQGEIESLRDRRFPGLEAGVGRLEQATEGVQAFGEELRDRRLPALSARVDALIAKLHEDLTSTAGLVERLAQREPLRVSAGPAIEARIPAAVAAASRRFIDTFRGSRDEILARVGDYVPLLRAAAPVLELGCGRGELLELLQQDGIECRGIDSDPAMVKACRRFGLNVAEGEALDSLRGVAAGSLGAVVAIHVLEHLPAAAWMSVVEAAASALRPSGLLLIECPNPESLRVGADLFWIDPTHQTPVHPEALEFVVRAVGLEVVERRYLHPFPPDQALADPALPAPVRAMAERLDGWLSAPRDFLVLARKPSKPA